MGVRPRLCRSHMLFMAERDNAPPWGARALECSRSPFLVERGARPPVAERADAALGRHCCLSAVRVLLECARACVALGPDLV